MANAANLPGGYTQIKYIQSTGTQYIDTGFKPNQNTRVVMDFEPTAAYSSWVAYFGTRDTAAQNAPNSFNFANSASNTFRSDYFSEVKTISTSGIVARWTVDKNKNVTTVGSYTVTHTARTGQCANTLALFAMNNAGEVSYFSKCKLYSCKIYDNGTLKRDFVPCVNASGAAGLYDTVGGAFYGNAGTGAFVAGAAYANTARIDAADLKSIKSRVKAEMLRRTRNGSVKAYGGAAYDYTTVPAADKAIALEHFDKNITPLRAVNPAGLPAAGAKKALYDDYTAIKAKLALFESKSIKGGTSDCASSCTGMCVNACSGDCWNSCSGCGGSCSYSCTGCDGSCSGGCYTGCNTTCSGGCKEGCNTTCKDGCKDGCNTTCKGTCEGCTGCSGGCSGGCIGGCSGTSGSQASHGHCSGCYCSCSRSCSDCAGDCYSCMGGCAGCSGSCKGGDMAVG